MALPIVVVSDPVYSVMHKFLFVFRFKLDECLVSFNIQHKQIAFTNLFFICQMVSGKLCIVYDFK